MDETTEAGRTISAATASELDKAIQAMKGAMSTVMRLIGMGSSPTPPAATPPTTTTAGESATFYADLSDLDERAFTQPQRDAMASKDMALPDGSYPIANGSDLKNAISAYGRAKDPVAVKAHILKRAKAMNLMNMLPQNWQESATEMEFATGDLIELAEFSPLLVLGDSGE